MGGGGGEGGSESKGLRGKIGLSQQSFTFSAVTSQQFCRRLWLYRFFSDLSCITDRIVDAPHLERHLESTSGRGDSFRVNMLFRFEMNISCIECEQDNISKLRSCYITS